jgi:hypothetical protein
MSAEIASTALAHRVGGRVRAFRRAMHEEAASHGVSARLADAVFLLPFVGSVAVAATRADKSVFKAVTGEDGAIEWLQFAGYAAAAVLGLAIARRLLQRGDRLVAAAYVLFVVACVVIAGEEISWGQRVFGFGTPEELNALNKQNETTIHNIGPVQQTFNVGLVVAGLYGWLVPLLLYARPRRASLGPRSRLLVPPLFLTACFFVVFGWKLGRFVVIPQNFTTVEFTEWIELCFLIGISTFVFLVARELGIARGARDAGPSEPSRPASER